MTCIVVLHYEHSPFLPPRTYVVGYISAIEKELIYEEVQKFMLIYEFIQSRSKLTATKQQLC